MKKIVLGLLLLCISDSAYCKPEVKCDYSAYEVQIKELKAQVFQLQSDKSFLQKLIEFRGSSEPHLIVREMSNAEIKRKAIESTEKGKTPLFSRKSQQRAVTSIAGASNQESN